MNPGSVIFVERILPPNQELRSRTHTFHPDLASSAAPTKELIPLPTKTASNESLDIRLSYDSRLQQLCCDLTLRFSAASLLHKHRSLPLNPLQGGRAELLLPAS